MINHYFNSRNFFSTEFPFTITRMRHSSRNFNDSMRCQREFWKIIYVISGHGEKIINDRKYPMSAGSLFVIHPDDKTTFNIESEFLEIYNILFMPELLSNEIKKLKSEFDFFAILANDFQDVSREYREMLYVLDSSKETEHLINRIEKEYRKKASNYRNMIKLYLQALLINISRLASGKLRKDKGENIVQYIDHIIETHFHETFDFDFLAAQIGLNKTYISRLYSKTTGKTITQTLLKYRLDCAMKMLHYSSKNISEICYECGFNDLSYFYRAFKTANGLNPGQYRKKFGL